MPIASTANPKDQVSRHYHHLLPKPPSSSPPLLLSSSAITSSTSSSLPSSSSTATPPSSAPSPVHLPPESLALLGQRHGPPQLGLGPPTSQLPAFPARRPPTTTPLPPSLATMHHHHHHHQHHVGLSERQQQFHQELTVTLRQVSPPLGVVHPQEGAGVVGNHHHHHPLFAAPIAQSPPATLLNLSPGLGPSAIEHRLSPGDIPQRRSLQEFHSHVGGSHMPHSPTFFPAMSDDANGKSESPNRKRRRVAMVSHNVVDSPPPPSLPSTRSWELVVGDRTLGPCPVLGHVMSQRRMSSQRRPMVGSDPVGSGGLRSRCSPTSRRGGRYRDRQLPEQQPQQQQQQQLPPQQPSHHHHHHRTFQSPSVAQQQHPHHHGFHPSAGTGLPPPHHGPMSPGQQTQAAPQQVVISLDQSQVSLPLAVTTHGMPIYSNTPVPLCTAPCTLSAMHTCAGIQFTNCQVYQQVLHPHAHSLQPHHIHHPSGPGPGQPHLLPPPQFVAQQAVGAQPQECEVDFMNDHRPPGMMGMPGSAVHHAAPRTHHHHHHHHHVQTHGQSSSLPTSPPLHLLQESAMRNAPPEAHFAPICSYHLPHARRIAPSRRVAGGRRWRSPVQPSQASYPGFLLHFLAMFSNPPVPTFGQDMVNPETTEAENYEALLNLAERLGEAKPRGLLKAEIEQLPSYRFNADTHQSDQTSCVVCMCDFEARQLLRVLPCNHEFHAKCVDKWLKTNRTCPICRGDASEYFNHAE